MAAKRRGQGFEIAVARAGVDYLESHYPMPWTDDGAFLAEFARRFLRPDQGFGPLRSLVTKSFWNIPWFKWIMICDQPAWQEDSVIGWDDP